MLAGVRAEPMCVEDAAGRWRARLADRRPQANIQERTQPPGDGARVLPVGRTPGERGSRRDGPRLENNKAGCRRPAADLRVLHGIISLTPAWPQQRGEVRCEPEPNSKQETGSGLFFQYSIAHFSAEIATLRRVPMKRSSREKNTPAPFFPSDSTP